MTMFQTLRESADYDRFLAVSARLGGDPLQVQAGGGNTSIKRAGAMWIKASGTWLAQAGERDIMVPVHQGDLLDALTSGDPAAESTQDFVSAQDAPRVGLRPSIETTMHAAVPHAVVLHSHCVQTIAVAIRADAEQQVAERLHGLGAVFVPYRKPGPDLAREMLARLRPDTRVLVLGNHGLLAGGATPDEAVATLEEAGRRLAPNRVANGPSHQRDGLEGPHYEPAAHPFLHRIADDAKLLERVAGGSYYPDHVVFLGPGVVVAEAGESDEAAAARLAAARGAYPELIFLPGRGAAIRRDASASARAYASCLADVFARVEPGVSLTTLTPEQEAELMDWEAEKYRRSLDTRQSSA